MKRELEVMNLDIDKYSYMALANIAQMSDVIIKAKLFNNGKEIILNGQTITLGGKTQTRVLEQTTGISIADNIINIDLKNDFVSETGKVEMDLTLKDSDGQLTTAKFLLNVTGKILSEDNINAEDKLDTIEYIVREFSNKADSAIGKFNSESKTELDNRKTEWDGLKKIAISENNAVDLQNQVNQVNSQLSDMEANELFISKYPRHFDESTDDGRFLRAISDLPLLNGIKTGTIHLSNVEYIMNKPLLLPPNVNLIGQGKTQTYIKKISSATSYVYGENINAVITFDNYTGSAHYGKISDLGIIKDNNISVDSAIYSHKPCPFLKLKGLEIGADFDYGVYLKEGTWLSTMEDIRIYKPRIAMKFAKQSTSLDLKNIYVLGAKEISYWFEAVSYSNAISLCSDFSKGIIYKIEYGEITLQNCATESSDGVTCTFELGNGAVLKVEGGTYYVNTDNVEYKFIKNSNCKTIFKGVVIGASVQVTSAGKLVGNPYNKGSVEFDTCKFNTKFSQSSDNIAGFKYKINGINYLGGDKSVASISDIEDDLANILGIEYKKKILLNSKTTPNTNQNNEDVSWGQASELGSIYTVNNPSAKGVAFFINKSFNGEYDLNGRISKVETGSNNFLWLSELSVVDNPLGRNLRTGDRLKIKNGGCELRSYVGKDDVGYKFYFTGNIPVVDETPKFYNPATYVRDQKYDYVQSIYVSYMGSLDRPTNPVDGQTIFDVSTKKQISFYSGRWYDAMGNIIS